MKAKLSFYSLIQSSIFLSLAALMSLIIGCGQPGSLGLEADPSNTAFSIDDQREREIQEVIKTCQNLMDQNKLSITSQMIRFEDTKVESGRTQVCEFGVGENLAIQNSYLRAQYTQNAKISLPENAVICDIDVESAEQDFRYDDIFFLTYNQAILASNHKSEIKKVISPVSFSRGDTQIDMYNYDWLMMRGTHFENVTNDLCLGSEEGLSECQWPVTEKFGKVKLNFDPEILIRLSQRQAANNQQISFVITGDNDRDLDCYHQRLDLDLNIKYYIK